MKQKTILYAVSAVLLIVVVLMGIILIRDDQTVPFFVEATFAEKTEQIKLWQDSDGTYYIFLPSCGALEQTRIRMNTEKTIFLEGVRLQDGMICEGFALDTPYELSYSAWGKKHRETVIFMRSANVPAMYIDTQSGSMDYIHEKKGNEESGDLRLYTATGEAAGAGQLESIKGRGNFTWSEYEKKAYSIKFTREIGMLGMEQAQKWVLLANAGDPSNLRNSIVYDYAKTVGLGYSPEYQWVELYLNGEYVGLYLLCERNEVHENRVDIAADDSFLVSLEVESKMAAQNYTYVTTQTQQAFRLHYPEVPTKQQLDALSGALQSAENALLAEDGVDVLTGKSWQDLIDVDSWAKKYLIEEVFANGDAGTISQYCYFDATDGTGKLHAGPVWDYDRTMGNDVAWQLVFTSSLFANRQEVNANYRATWFFALYQKELFRERVEELFKTEFMPWFEKNMQAYINQYSMYIDRAAELNGIRWDGDRDIYAQSTYIVNYLTVRTAFLNRLWVKKDAYFRIRADQSFGANYAYMTAFKGERLAELPAFSDTDTSTFLGWYYEGTNEPFDPEAPITEDIEIYAKWQEKPGKQFKQLAKLVPLGVIAVLGVVLLAVELRRWKKSR